MRAGTVRAGYLYRGVIRDGNKIVWTCEHLHHNRDMSPGIRQSARDCAAKELQMREVAAEFDELRRLEDRATVVRKLTS